MIPGAGVLLILAEPMKMLALDARSVEALRASLASAFRGGARPFSDNHEYRLARIPG